MADDFERRALLDCRVTSEDGRRLSGYAIKFHSLSVDLGGFQEYIAPEAVDRSLRDALDIRALVDHDSSKVIGRTRSGTLTLRKDTTGLAFTMEPDPAISYANDIMRAVSRGDVSGMSFGFRTLADEWNFEGDTPIRTVTDMRISEISVVTFPAYPSTDVAMRSLNQVRESQKGSSIAWLRKVHRTRLAR